MGGGMILAGVSTFATGSVGQGSPHALCYNLYNAGTANIIFDLNLLHLHCATMV